MATSNGRARRLRRGLAALALLAAVYAAASWVHWTAPARAAAAIVAPPAGDVDAFVAGKIAESARLGARPGFEERLVRRAPAPAKTRVAVLYLHGFGACRAEGEATVDPLAEELGASVYYPRLPGHGEPPDAHAARRFEEYVVTGEQSLEVARALGDRVLVVATSTGALLASWLASRHPDAISALVMASPLYAYARPESVIVSLPGGIAGLKLMYGPNRDVGWKDDPEHRKLAGYDDHWMTLQRWDALRGLDDLRRLVTGDHVLEGIRAPVLLLHTTQARDGAVNVEAMLRGFARMNGGAPARASRVVQIEDGSHVLTSAFVRSDKPRVNAEIRAFLRDVGLM